MTTVDDGPYLIRGWPAFERFTGIPPSTVQDWLKRGIVPPLPEMVRLGGKIPTWKRHELVAWLDQLSSVSGLMPEFNIPRALEAVRQKRKPQTSTGDPPRRPARGSTEKSDHPDLSEVLRAVVAEELARAREQEASERDDRAIRQWLIESGLD